MCAWLCDKDGAERTHKHDVLLVQRNSCSLVRALVTLDCNVQGLPAASSAPSRPHRHERTQNTQRVYKLTQLAHKTDTPTYAHTPDRHHLATRQQCRALGAACTPCA